MKMNNGHGGTVWKTSRPLLMSCWMTRMSTDDENFSLPVLGCTNSTVMDYVVTCLVN